MANGGGRVLRRMARERAFTLPAGGMLALAAGSAAALVTVLHAVLLKPLPFPEAHRLVTLCERHSTLEGYCNVSPPNLVDLAGDPSLDAAGMARDWGFQVAVDGERVRVATGLATPGVFQALSVVPVLGRLPLPDETGEEDGRVVLLSHGLWQLAFQGAPDVVGRTLTLDGMPHTVLGVLPQGTAVPGLEGIQLWRPPLIPPTQDDIRGWRGFRSYARLAAGVSLGDARRSLEARYGRLMEVHADITPEWRLAVIPLLDRVVGSVRSALLLLGGAVALLVLIAGANLMALQMVRHLRRSRQQAIRAVLGASRGVVAREELGQALALGSLAGLLALAPAWGLLVALRAVAPAGLPRLDEVGFSPVTAGAAWAVALLLPLVGWALLTGRPYDEASLAGRLRQGTGGGEAPARGRLRRALVTLELALSLVLLAGASALARSFAAYRAWDPGFDPRGVVTAFAGVSTSDAPTPADALVVWQAVESALGALPGVRTAATVSAGPLFGGRETAEARSEGATGPGVAVRWYDASPGYFQALSIPVVRGRDLAESDRAGAPPVAVVNETLARRLWGQADPLGRRVALDAVGDPFTVVGVVADRAPLTPGAPVEPELWWSNRQLTRWGTTVVVRLDPLAPAGLRQVQDALDRAHPALDAGAFTPLATRLDRALAGPRFQMLLVGAFAGLAALLAAAGLYGLMSFAVTQRLGEMGVRLALGASRGRLAAEVLTWAAPPLGLGVLLGVPLGLVAGSVLERTLPGVTGAGGGALITATGVLLVVAALAAVQPAVRAGRTADPLSLLKE